VPGNTGFHGGVPASGAIIPKAPCPASAHLYIVQADMPGIKGPAQDKHPDIEAHDSHRDQP
jgi:hypothetical protein